MTEWGLLFAYIYKGVKWLHLVTNYGAYQQSYKILVQFPQDNLTYDSQKSKERPEFLQASLSLSSILSTSNGAWW